jgi:HD-like signal output (HDOD) protein
MTKTILFVDDEPHVLHALARAFLDAPYQVLTSATGEEALAVFQTQSVDLIVSDMRMAGMDGYELLAAVKERWPSTMRMVLSGYSDKVTMLKAITDGVAKAYVAKPWNDNELKKQIDHLFSAHDALSCSGVLETINRIDKLPVLPSLYYRVIDMIQQEANISDIAKIIEREPGWVARILKVINSAFYGISVSSVHQAVTFLGMVIVKDIILSSDLFESVKGQGCGEMHVDFLWEHSNACNKILHSLHQAVHNRSIPEEFALLGVLHDIGKLLILKHFPDKLDSIVHRQELYTSRARAESERVVLGTSHAELGAFLLDWWNLPQALVESCLYHHDPLNKAIQNKEIIALVSIADFYSWKLARRNPRYELPQEVFETAGTTRSDIVQCLKRVFPEYHE